MKRIEWKVKNVEVLSKSVRVKKDIDTGGPVEYCVLGIKLSRYGSKNDRKVKPPAIMCFENDLYKRIEEEEVYSFEGFVSFGMGNTFFVVQKVKDELDNAVNDKKSIFYDLPSDG